MGCGDVLTMICPAKVNMALSVGTANRDGLHPLASWMVAVAFGDTLTLAKVQGPDSRFHITPADDGPTPPPHDQAAALNQGIGTYPTVQVNWPLADDLAYRAHSHLQRHVGHLLPVELGLSKRIPTGAGLGGGSSDAAATLVGLDRLFNLGLDDATLIRVGLDLGSDVGFLVEAALGTTSAIVTGLGEQIQPLPPATDPIHLTLVLPRLSCPTGLVYAAFDDLTQDGPTTTPNLQRVRAIADARMTAQDEPFNDLTAAACRVQPKLADLIDLLHYQLRQPVHVTGSGSAVFLVGPSHAACQQLAQEATTLTGLPALATRTI